MKDPLWKVILNWGAVAMFLGLPMLMLAIQLTYWTNPNLFLAVDPEHPKINYLLEFQRNVTILVFGLAGLRTWEHVKANGKTPIELPSPEVSHPRKPKTLESKI